ncbi:MAG: beta-hydroxyacyl-ACP dehydratase [Desulfobulbaceae bacterium]|nr:beta-hydroxyacyl-ACP dehydratase [Desulfobulbaceae bacterium]
MTAIEDVTALIPHRPPFLFVDKIISASKETIVTEKVFPENLDMYSGHYPGNPITPGVILCEAIFQSGALLMGKINEDTTYSNSEVPVLTRITNAKFKRTVYPGESTEITVQIQEIVANVCFFKGTMRVAGKVALKVEFACSMVKEKE